MPAKPTIKVARGLQRAAVLLPEMVRKELNSFSLEGNSWDFPSPLLSSPPSLLLVESPFQSLLGPLGDSLSHKIDLLCYISVSQPYYI